MVQELTSNSRVAVIGAGPAGCICAKVLSDAKFEVSVFDKGKFLWTILPTGGGKCNLAHAEYDFKELAKNYPRGEKFLYSVFSRFGTFETLEFFKSIGVDTYVRDDNRVFPVSNSSSEVREKLLKSISNTNFINEEIKNIKKLNNGYKIVSNKSSYAFDAVVVAIGGHSNLNILEPLKLQIVPQTQSLVGLVLDEDYSGLAGVSLKKVIYKNLIGDILFTHKGISGPLIYTISSMKAKDSMPYNLSLKIIEDINFQELLDKNSHKEIKNLLSIFVPKSFAVRILHDLNIDENIPCHRVNGLLRDKIYNKLTNFEVTVISKCADGEVVTCGGVALDEINSKTMEAKNYPNLYFCGEVLDIDGFCGGFNLQNCWSTGYVAAQSIVEKFST